MSTLVIRKKSLKTWLHTDSILGDFIISKFYFNADSISFQIVEQGQSKRVIYNISDITLYALPTGGSDETFTTITALSLRLEQLNYPAFQYDGQITSIANLIDAGTNITITGDGTEASPYVISASGGGGGSQTLAQTLVLGNITDGEDIFLSDGDKVLLDNGANLKKGTTDAGLGGSKGIALRCAVDYELKWEAGRLYVMEGDGFTIREVSYNFTSTPTATDDDTKGFVIGSRWILDNGDLYLCTDSTSSSAVWELQSNIPTLQQIIGNDRELIDGNNFQGTFSGNANTGINVNALGNYAANDNQGSNVNAFGDGSANQNTGDNVNAFGNSASSENTGTSVNAFGDSSSIRNTGNYVNALGASSAYENTGTHVNALGAGAGFGNTADNVNIFGYNFGLGFENIFKNVNLFGFNSTADADNQTVFSKWISGTTRFLARLSFNNITANRKWELPDESGTIALTSIVSDTITNGVIDKAPSQNAVFDALALKQDKVSGVSDTEISYLDGVTSAIQTQLNNRKRRIITDTTSVVVSGTTGLVLAKTYELTAGTLSASGFLDVYMFSSRTAGGNAHSMGLYINTTNNFGTATLITTMATAGNFNPILPAKLQYILKDNLLISGLFSQTSGSNFPSSATRVSVACNNTSSSVWLFVGVTLASGQTITLEGVEILN